MRFHFTAEKGWINDPNGLIKIGEDYHIFYQYYPDDIVWGPMHWGHAVSKDLMNFEHKKTAIFPDELGYAFSGSAILDRDNVSGLGKDGHPALICFYTSHNPDTGEEQQSIAYSVDYENFEKYEGNPVVTNHKDDPGFRVDYRDPKVFVNPVKGGYTMVLAAGHKLEFLHSENLIDWKKTGDFEPGINGLEGISECPDCICLPWQNGTKWVVTLSTILDEKDVGKSISEGGFFHAHTMQYFVGEFDGDTFVADEDIKEPLIMEFGPDNYAMVSFAGCKDSILYGWGENWDYAKDTPAQVFRGKMTVPRIAKLTDTDRGLRMAMMPLENIPQEKVKLNPGDTYRIVNSKCHEVLITVWEDAIEVDRSGAVKDVDSDLLKKDEYNVFRAERYTGGTVTLTLVMDNDYVELFAEDGLLVFSFMTF